MARKQTSPSPDQFPLFQEKHVPVAPDLGDFATRVAASASNRLPATDRVSKAHQDLGGNSHTLTDAERTALIQAGLGGPEDRAAAARAELHAFYAEQGIGPHVSASIEQQQTDVVGRLKTFRAQYPDIVAALERKHTRPDGQVNYPQVLAILRARYGEK